MTNARLMPGHIRALLRGSPSGSVKIRLTKVLPPFSMYIAAKDPQERSLLRVQQNFAHTRHGRDRPTFRLAGNSPWFGAYEDEFQAFWEKGKKYSVEQLQSRIDNLTVTIKNLDAVHYASTRPDRCPFDEGQQEVSTVYFESELSRVLYDISPIVEGHSLVVPKRHVERVGDLGIEEFIDLFETCRIVSRKVVNALGATGMDWALQDGISGGQTVPHVHIHFIPRVEGDLGKEPGDWFGALPGGVGLARAIESNRRGRLNAVELQRRVEKYRHIAQ